jgi:hypothetical protein
MESKKYGYKANQKPNMGKQEWYEAYNVWEGRVMRQFIIRDKLNLSGVLRIIGNLCKELLTNRDVDITVKYAETQRSIDQNAKLHCILTDVAKQVAWHGQKLPMNTWKRLTMAAFLRELGEQPQLIPALDGQGFDVIFERTSKLGVRKCSKLIEWIYAFGAENDVTWSETVPEEYQQYAQIEKEG